MQLLGGTIPDVQNTLMSFANVRQKTPQAGCVQHQTIGGGRRNISKQDEQPHQRKKQKQYRVTGERVGIDLLPVP